MSSQGEMCPLELFLGNSMQPPSQGSEPNTSAVPEKDATADPKFLPPRLPPRIVIELPDGAVMLGENSDRLLCERTLHTQQVEVAQGRGPLPGTERFLELRRLLYASALDSHVVTRRRHAALVLSALQRPSARCTIP